MYQAKDFLAAIATFFILSGVGQATRQSFDAAEDPSVSILNLGALYTIVFFILVIIGSQRVYRAKDGWEKLKTFVIWLLIAIAVTVATRAIVVFGII